MLSDNASTYLAAAEELKKLFECDVIKEALGLIGNSCQTALCGMADFGSIW